MRDPAPRVDPRAEAAIEETCRFLESCKRSESWNGDPDGFASDMRATIDEVEGSNLPDWAKDFAIFALFEQTKKRRGKPKRTLRNGALQMAAARLVIRGYKPTRNEAMRHTESASSIIHQALRRLGETMTEKSIGAVVAQICRDVRKRPDIYRDVLK